MKPGSSVQLGRAIALLLTVILLVGFGLCQSAAQNLRGGGKRQGAPPPSRRFDKPLSSYNLHDLPLQRITREQAIAWKSQNDLARRTKNPAAAAPAPPPTQPQFIDLTTNPRPPLVGPSTKCQEIHPAWSGDQQYIFLSSNNVDDTVSGNYGLTTPPANARFHVYRITSDGAFIQQVTGVNFADELSGNQLYPRLNRSQTKLAYVHRPSPAEPAQLFVLTFPQNPADPPVREQLTGLPDPRGVLGPNTNMVDVQHPSWSPGDGVIAFAARNRTITNDPLNIYVVDLNTTVVRRLTNATPASGVECKDPDYHPDQAINRIAFAANTGNPVNGGVISVSGDLNYRSNPRQDLDGDGQVDDIDHNLFTVAENGPSAGAPIQQLTTATADDIEPGYNQSDYPPGQGQGNFNNWLAFASLGRRPDPTTPIGTTYDIYFNDGSAENLSRPIRLFTPDTNAGAIPLNRSNERYPTWSAGLPPQNPIDRIAFSSNRQNNVNDLQRPTVSATDTDIWAAEVTDITPPTLFSFDEQAGETMRIVNSAGRRLGTAGERFFFFAKMKDLQYGVESVWAQIKDPDGPSTDSQGLNHRLYGVGTFPTPFRGEDPFNNVYAVRWVGPPLVPTHFAHIPFETDYRGIGVSDYEYFNSPVRDDDAGWSRAQYASFNPGVDDSVRWSGNQVGIFNPQRVRNRPPLDANGNNRWLRLNDDGNFPDQVAGDDLYSASWVTPDEPSDYYVDLIAYDKAFNPQDPTQQQNWIIYDDIWGFSTQPFVSRNQVLYVDDNGCGQKWPRGLKGSFRPFREFRYGTESDIIDRPSQFKPMELRGVGDPQVAPFNLVPISDPAAFTAGQTNEVFDFLTGNAISSDFITWWRSTLRAYRYDYWRILAKGPLPETVINLYAPTKDQQPLNITGTQTIQRPVPRRAVVWNSPYTGDVFLGSGSILDQATQSMLTRYRSRAGRLVVAGGDILWALTINGTVPQQFVRDTLGATFGQDETYGNWAADLNGPLAQAITHDAANPVEFTPVATPPYWGDFYDIDPIGTQTSWAAWFTNPPIGGGNSDFRSATDGTPFRTQDSVAPVDSSWEHLFQDRMIGKNDPTTQSKTIFMSFSLASMGRCYVAENDTTAPLHCMNYRAKLSHAMFCWMFSADLVGQVRSLGGPGGTAPISGAWIQAFQGGQLVGSAFSRADGTYSIRGLPVGGWTIVVNNPGYASFNKATGSGAHGLTQAQLDILLSPAAPGSISGKVLDQFQQPIPNVKIKATIQASPLYTGQRDFFATTGLDGKYIIPSAPVGTFDVMVDQPYPPLFDNPTPATQQAIVRPAQDTPNIDFVMQGQPGPLTVRVFEQNADGTKGAPVPGADVTLIDSTNTPIPGFTGVTDSTGTVVFTNVPPGPIKVSAFKFGRQEGTANVNIPQQNYVEILLAPAAARDLYGLAVREIDKAPLSASVLPVQLRLLRRASGLPTPLTANVFSPRADTPVVHNYKFTGAQEGLFLVALRNHPRFEDKDVAVDITATLPNVAPVLELKGRPGILTGTVREDSGGRPGIAIAGARVQIISQVVSAGQTIATVTSGSDGKWTTGTTIPSDLYTLTVRKFGHSTKTVTDVFVAGDTNAGDILLTRAPRGQIYGLVRRSVDQLPRGGVKIEFWLPANSPFGQQKISETTSFLPPTNGPDGQPRNYTIGATATTSESLPEGDYDMRVTGDPRFANFTRRITVVGGQARREDIDLTPLPGVLSGAVKENVSGRPGQPIAGATVTIRNGSTTVATLTTDANGEYKTATAIAAANYTITASAFGFEDNSVNAFVEGPTRAPDILLRRLPPSSVSGAVRNRVDRSFIGGAKVEILPANGSGTVVASTTSTPTGTGTPPANFRFAQVPPGNYIIRASKPGWRSAQTNLTVNPGVNITGIELLLDPQHTFGRGLLLVSLPDDFPGQDAAALFEQPAATFKSAYWLTDQVRYAIYPERPAAEFRLGKGMFVRFHNATAFAKAGTPAPNAPFSLPVKAGWNLIGSVRRQRIEWLRVKVATSDGTVRTMQQAMDQGIIQNGLFGYTDGYFRSDFMDPFAGYFMRALRECTLIIPVNNAVGSVTPADRKKLAFAPAPSLNRVAAELRAAGLAPYINQLNRRKTSGMGSPLGLPGLPVSGLFKQRYEYLAWPRPGLAG